MELAGRVAVVTGGGGGIGEGLCRAFAAEGARAVVVADIDGDAALRVAADLTAGGTTALGLPMDAGFEPEVQGLVHRTEDELGPIDLFCANAGIIVTGGVEVPDDAWERIWRVNFQSHVYAARAVLPGMLARGEGYLLHTASAAGLLTQLGSAPYSVTKHAVVGLAEWLAITHGDAGIRVSCLCPQAVQTGMTRGTFRRPGDDQSSTARRDGVLLPEEVARVVVEGLRDERFLILPHPEVATYEQRRAGDRERWLKGMRRMQAAMVAAWRSPTT
jgi:NAD(P)-dependent dehydrogenase (short-subunit alcohol dehydrogenase family)